MGCFSVHSFLDFSVCFCSDDDDGLATVRVCFVRDGDVVHDDADDLKTLALVFAARQSGAAFLAYVVFRAIQVTVVIELVGVVCLSSRGSSCCDVVG